MKKLLVLIVLLISMKRSSAQVFELEQLALDIQKLAHLKSILTDLYKGYEIVCAGYNSIKKISEGNFNLHQAFLDGLLMVSPAIRKYQRIADIISYQGRIISASKSALRQFRKDRNFNSDEIIYLGQVYNYIVKQSLKNLEDLLNVVTDSKLRMSDDERLHTIDGIYSDVKDKWTFLVQFNNSTAILAMQRAVDKNDVETLRSIYGLNY